MNIIEQLEKEQAEKIAEKRPVPDFRPGDTVVVAVRVKEGERSRIQNFEGVERVFPLYSPLVEDIRVVRYGRVRRAKLYYLRGRTGKAARIPEELPHRVAKRKAENGGK